MNNKEILNFAEDIETTPVNWLWYPYIPLGKITIVQGNSGEGKTMLALNIAAALSKGKPLFGETEPREPVSIIYNTAEDGLSDTIKPRLESAGADCTRINTINERVNPLSMTDDRLELSVAELSAKLLILDPIQAYLGANVDMNKANETRPIFAHLGRIAEEQNCAVVLIGHKGKNQAYSDINALLGSMDQVAAARSVLTVAQDAENKTRSLIHHTKSSLAPRGQSISFSIEDGKIAWGEFVETPTDANIPHETKLNMAMEFIREILANGALPQSEIISAAEKENFSKRTLDTAKGRLNVRSYKANNKWYWTL